LSRLLLKSKQGEELQPRCKRSTDGLAIFDEKPQTCQPRYRYAVLLRTTVPELKQFKYCAMGLSNELAVLRSTDFLHRNSTGKTK